MKWIFQCLIRTPSQTSQSSSSDMRRCQKDIREGEREKERAEGGGGGGGRVEVASFPGS